MPDAPPLLSRTVRIGTASDPIGACAAEALPVPRPAPDADPAHTSASRDALPHRIGPAPLGLGFELDHLRSLRSGEAVTTWALHRLDLPGAAQLELYAKPAATRIPASPDQLG